MRDLHTTTVDDAARFEAARAFRGDGPDPSEYLDGYEPRPARTWRVCPGCGVETVNPVCRCGTEVKKARRR